MRITDSEQLSDLAVGNRFLETNLLDWEWHAAWDEERYMEKVKDKIPKTDGVLVVCVYLEGNDVEWRFNIHFVNKAKSYNMRDLLESLEYTTPNKSAHNAPILKRYISENFGYCLTDEYSVKRSHYMTKDKSFNVYYELV